MLGRHGDAIKGAAPLYTRDYLAVAPTRSLQGVLSEGTSEILCLMPRAGAQS